VTAKLLTIMGTAKVRRRAGIRDAQAKLGECASTAAQAPRHTSGRNLRIHGFTTWITESHSALVTRRLGLP